METALDVRICCNFFSHFGKPNKIHLCARQLSIHKIDFQKMTSKREAGLVLEVIPFLYKELTFYIQQLLQAGVECRKEYYAPSSETFLLHERPPVWVAYSVHQNGI